MGNPKRLLILCALVSAEYSVGDLADLVGLSQSALSQHLAKLRCEAGDNASRGADGLLLMLSTMRYFGACSTCPDLQPARPNWRPAGSIAPMRLTPSAMAKFYQFMRDYNAPERSSRPGVDTLGKWPDVKGLLPSDIMAVDPLLPARFRYCLLKGDASRR